MADKLIRAALIVIILLIIGTNVCRFLKLDSIPYGYHVDEAASGTTMQCMKQHCADAELNPWPFFGQMQYGSDKSPVYLYLGKIWVEIFGASIGSLRGFSSAMVLVGVLGLFFLLKLLYGRTAAILGALAATCSPWAWVVGRVAYESSFAPFFVIWGLYFILRSTRWWDWCLASVMFALAVYTYPPARIQVPMMAFTLMGYLYISKRFELKAFIGFGLTTLLSLIPMGLLYLNGGLQQRFNEISIFNQAYLESIGRTNSWTDVIAVFFNNFLLHLTPDFLFFTGDPSYLHTTRRLGILSYLDILALVLGLVLIALVLMRKVPRILEHPFAKDKAWLVFLGVNFLIGIIPSALTNQELPHSLRICGSWPFVMIFTAGMLSLAVHCSRFFWMPILASGILSVTVLVYQYFYLYPQESKGMFNFWVNEQVDAIKTDDDMKRFLVMTYRKNYHVRYFLVEKYGMTCREANDFWWKLYRQLENKP